MNARPVSPGGEPAELRHRTSTTKHPPGSRCATGVDEARHLIVLARQVPDRVVDEVGQPERPPHLGRGEVADRHTDVSCAGLRLQSCGHGGGQLDPVDPHTALAEWQGETPGADAQFEGGSVSGEIGEEVDRRVDDRRLELIAESSS